MDYHNRAGSKKGGGGIATESQFNVQRRRQVETLLSGGQEIPFTFQEESDESSQGTSTTRQNPYIYKNHSGKLVCKLCNTMHMSWTSVERHLKGKKHGLNVIRRNNAVGGGKLGVSQNGTDVGTPASSVQFQRKVEAMRLELTYDAGLPQSNVVNIKHAITDVPGIAMRVKYPVGKDGKKQPNDDNVGTTEYPPFLRVVTGLELQNTKDKDKKFLVVSNPPFENIALEIPSNVEVKGGITYDNFNEGEGNVFVDDLNRNCTLWDHDSGTFFVQCYFEKNMKRD